ncbi:MAG: tetratricopeptide repeat protein [Candidatus Omnitrophica bacterium]|nr:tetratricopeptide repeat protein [Candidatus Omnitrophota bacterium]
MTKRRKQYHVEPSTKIPSFIPTPDTYRWIVIIVIIAVGIAAYFNTFFNSFIWDDELLILRNEYIRSWSHLKDIFITDVHRFGNIRSNFYRPTQTLSYMIDYTFWKYNPMGYHISNALIHITNAVILYLLLFSIVDHIRRIWPQQVSSSNKSIALTASLLWLIHPIHTQCTSYISGRADLLCVTFILLAVYAYINAKKRYLPIIFFLLALISKEPAIITPLLFLAYDAVATPRGKEGYKYSRNAFRRYLPYIVIVIVFLIVRSSIRFPGAPFADAKVDLYSRLLTSGRAIIILLGLLVWPFGLNMSRNIPWELTLINAKVFASVAALFALFIYTVSIRRKEKVIFFGILWFFIAYIPMANIFPVNANVSEHWMYLPSIGFFLIVSYLIWDKLFKYKYLSFAVSASLVIFYGTLTVLRNFDWKNEVTFYEKTLKSTPNSARVHYNLGNAYGIKGTFEKAMEHYKIAIDLKPDYAEAYGNMGIIFFRRGELDRAIELFEKANYFKGDLVENHCNLAMAYEKKGLLDKARREFEITIELKPNHYLAYNGLGIVNARMGNYKEAEYYFSKTLEYNPSDESAKNNIKRIQELMKEQEAQSEQKAPLLPE